MKKLLFFAAAVSLIIAACDSQDANVSENTDPSNPVYLEDEEGSFAKRGRPVDETDEKLRAFGDGINAKLEALDSDFRLAMVETYTLGEELGRTVVFSDFGNKRLPFDFVPGDPRRVDWSGAVGPGDDITWASETFRGDAGPGFADTQAAIDRAMATWDSQTCSVIPLTKVAGPVPDLGVVEFIVSGTASGFFFPAADITHSGFGTVIDVAIFDSDTIAGTFTFVFESASGTDINNDRRIDVAIKEIYYNTTDFTFGIDSDFPIDVETVALHEAGHGLSQAHFGQLFATPTDSGPFDFFFAPRAVMNAGYTGIQQTITNSDLAGHCANWGDWPVH